jgi:hypothetical protein
MKTALLLFLLALPLMAEVRIGARGGLFAGGGNDPVGTIEIDARYRGWSVAPAAEIIRGGYGLHAYHVDLRRLFQTRRNTIWVGVGPTWAQSTSDSKTTWNIDAGVAWRSKSAWEPFVAARYYRFRMSEFRDSLEETGPVISAGISRRLF